MFPFWCSRPPDEADVEGGEAALFRVNVLVHGDFLLTVHERDVDLPELVAEGGIAAGRSESYVVYVVLDGMTNALLETLSGSRSRSAIENTLLESGLQPRARAAADQADALAPDHAAASGRPERSLFERVSEEIEHVTGWSPTEVYFERILTQLDRTVDRIDAASGALSNMLTGQLNVTTYRLTVVATIFLPSRSSPGSSNELRLAGRQHRDRAPFLTHRGIVAAAAPAGPGPRRPGEAAGGPPASRPDPRRGSGCYRSVGHRGFDAFGRGGDVRSSTWGPPPPRAGSDRRCG